MKINTNNYLKRVQKVSPLFQQCICVRTNCLPILQPKQCSATNRVQSRYEDLRYPIDQTRMCKSVQQGWAAAQVADHLPGVCKALGPARQLSMHTPGTDVHTCNPSMWEVILSTKRLQGQPGYQTACLRAGEEHRATLCINISKKI